MGGEADATQLNKLMSELEGKNIADLIASGKDKLQSVSAAMPAAGGGGGGGGAAAAPAAAAAPEPESEEEEMELDLFG